MASRRWTNGIQKAPGDGASTTLLLTVQQPRPPLSPTNRGIARAPLRSRARGQCPSTESGAVHLLATLSLALLVVLIAQLFVPSAVDHAVARSELEFTRVEHAARAGIEVAKAVLRSEDRPTGRTLRLASDLTVDISFESKDRRMNVLWLACEDGDTRDECTERFVRLLDGLREGSALDLSLGEAESIVKGTDRHLTVERPPEMPVPSLPTMLKEQSKFAWSESRFSNRIEEPVLCPLGLAEIMHMEDVTDGLIHDEKWDGLNDALAPRRGARGRAVPRRAPGVVRLPSGGGAASKRKQLTTRHNPTEH